jgi:DUF4097 and DUF4098 domain-containing protein YvlB
MRTRGSVAAPLVLIAVGVLFLIHAVSPDFRIAMVFGDYWPYFLIVWGVLQLGEIGVRVVRGRPIPIGGISGGGWLVALLICMLGWGTFEFRRADTWWRKAGFAHGVAVFGDEHDYALPVQERQVGRSPHIVITDFRGNAKITGGSSTAVSLRGTKTVRSLSSSDSDETDKSTPVEMIVKGDNTVVIRCHQDSGREHNLVTTNLELTVPEGASVQAVGSVGDFDVSSLNGDLDLRSGNAGVKVRDIHGSVKIDLGKSDDVNCEQVNGSVTIRGHGDDVELTKINGPVAVTGDYSGTISLAELGQPVRIQTMRTEFTLNSVPGSVKLDRGSIEAQNITGPSRIATRSTDVTVRDFAGALNIQVDKGDVSVSSANPITGNVSIHGSGDVQMSLPDEGSFVLAARTNRGSIDNQFGGSIQEQTIGAGAHVEGVIGKGGAQVEIVADHGDIQIRKSSSSDDGPRFKVPKPPSVPKPPHPAARDLV